MLALMIMHFPHKQDIEPVVITQECDLDTVGFTLTMIHRFVSECTNTLRIGATFTHL
jgi:hypothetical protein